MSANARKSTVPAVLSHTETRTNGFALLTWILAFSLLGSGMVMGIDEPDRSALREMEYRHPDLTIEHAFRSPHELASNKSVQAGTDLSALGAPTSSARIDSRSGRWATITPATPMIPGVGNTLTWQNLGRGVPPARAELEAAVESAFRAYLGTNAVSLRIDPTEAQERTRITLHGDGQVAQVYQQRVVDGVRVRGSHLSAVLNSGNLILFGAEKWGDIDVSTTPTVSDADAMAVAQSHVHPFTIDGSWGKRELVLVPLTRGRDARRVAFGDGYTYRLAHLLRPSVAGDLGHWEVLIDAHSGELISFEDTNRYAEVKGGVYPVTNDGIAPDGVEQAGWPMPYDNVSTTGGTVTTDTGGNLTAFGNMTSSLAGQYIRINDNCGAISLTQADTIDFGTSSGSDCVTPGFGGAGNTHASRTGFFELNKMVEMGRGQLPGNTWLQQQLTANMNINNTCNAFWNGSTVNFYRSGGGCFNTGEIAGVFDHEWGHGMDANDATPGIASPSGEGIADIYTALRLNTSCIGRNFRSTVCTGFGDPCETCTGVRDIDYLKRQSGQPHTYTWSNANCGGSVHCIGAVYAEAVWSLWKRELQQAPYNYDNNTAHEIVNRLTFIGAGNVDTWFSGGPPFGGCGASGGYLNYLAADDDDGNLNNGTPHMAAIFNAFNDQEIACGTPVVQDSGCAATPTIAPTVTTSDGNQLVALSWNAVPDATKYQVFRTEGVFACEFGKVKLGETAGTSWNDTGLQNGRDYSYVVIPIGAADSCMGPASFCATDQPIGQPDFAVTCTPAHQSIAQGDSDTAACTVFSSFGYTGTVGLSCSGNPLNLSCAFAPASVSPPADGIVNSTLTVTVDGGQATGTYAFDVTGDDGVFTRSSGISVLVFPAGSDGPQDAIYDAGLGAPKCTVAGSPCDSTTLLDSRGTLSPAEPNQPNTLDACTDGSAGSYHSDESNDRLVVRTLDGGNFTEGDTIEIAATVWAWSTGTEDTLDLYYAADASSPVWTYITSLVPPSGGAQTLTAQYVLPAGGMQAVRASYRYQGAQSSCSTGTYDDADDLVFAVEPLTPGCTMDSQCDDGDFCDGAEICDIPSGTCQPGTAPACDDGLFCNGAETCNETTDSCDPGTPPVTDDSVSCTDDTCDEANDIIVNTANDANCDNGDFCDGAETCDAVNDCQAGTDPCVGLFCDESADACVACVVDTDCDDGAFCNGAEMCSAGVCAAGAPPALDDLVGCTDDSCDEVNDIIVHVPNSGLCDDGAFCNGAETCDAVIDCQAGTAPTTDDGVACTDDSCDEANDIIVNAPNSGLCDDGAFCNGAETCDAVNDCQAGTAPTIDDLVGCTDDSCDEVNDIIVNTANDANCDNGTFCDGAETCDAISDCQAGSDPCVGSICDEGSNACVACAIDADCDNGLFCDGAETCDANNVCQAGTPPDANDAVSCTVDSCDEATDSIVNAPNDSLCDNGAFCDGAETCDAISDCQAGTPVVCADGVGCTVDACNEGTDSCDNVPNDSLCDNGEFCDGAETCNAILDCQTGTDPCAGGVCDEVGDVCEGGSAAQLESDTITAGGLPVTVTLDNSYVSPVVVATVHYSNNTTPVVTRVSNVTSNTFDVWLQNPSGGAVANDTVTYLVVEEGTWTIDGVAVEAQAYTSTVTDENNSWVGEPQSYNQAYTNPVVLGQVMSANDSNFSVFWSQGSARTSPPSASALRTGKTVCEDSILARADETVGIIVFEAGHAAIGGVEFEAATGADSVAGVSQSPPYSYSFATPFAGAPTVASVQMAGVDGNNGGWAQIHGSTSATPTTLFLSIDEDQIQDSERAHTTEQVAYAVFAGPVVYPATLCTIDADCDDQTFCNGTETCDIPSGICQAGTPPVCDDGAFCNGAETCNESSDTCDQGAPPVIDDGVGCTDDSCDEINDIVVNQVNDANCDNGLFCDGAETCDAVNDCQAGTDPCSGGVCDEVNDICEGGTGSRIWMSFRNATSVPGVGNVADEDVVSYDEATGLWALEFDGSDVGLGSNEIDGLALLPDGDLLLSLREAGAGFDDSDILRFTPTNLGPSTSGTFSMYFDGSDVGLNLAAEDVDAVALADDGRLIISIEGTSGPAADEDLYIFSATSLGQTTSGTFAQYFDGSDVGLSNSSAEDVDAASLTSGGNLLFSTLGPFSVSGLSGADEDVVEFSGTFGVATSGSFLMRLDLSTLGIDGFENVGSLSIVE